MKDFTKKTASKIVVCLWAIFGTGLIFVFLLFFSISKGWLGYMPSVEELESPIDKFATQIISSDGELLGTFSYTRDNRVWVDFNELSPWLVRALISTEDIRFLDHSGIDFKALSRAIVKRLILQQKSAGGGSTLTQQLAKLLYTEQVARNSFQRMFQKPIEWVIAVRLERYYTKEEILVMYLNKYDFGNNAIGISTAAKAYFGKSPLELNAQESAMLVGMCKNSSLYNPLRRAELTHERRNVVLGQMGKAGYLSDIELDSLRTTELIIDYHRVDHKQGLATYFREYLRSVMTAKKPQKKNYRGWQEQQYYEDSLDWIENPLFGWCNKNLNTDNRPYDIYSDGLKIYVTIDSRMQQYAEQAIDEHVVDYLQPNFFIEKGKNKPAPFTNSITPEQLENILIRAMRQSDRYRSLQKKSVSEQDIRKIFDTPCQMTLFSYKGDLDTIMSPMDSIRYLKYYLRAGFIAMEPITGHVKAYVGGPEFGQFQYDMATQGRRQVGSTIKPFLYSLAMESGFTPCDQTINQTQTILTEAGQIWRPRDEGSENIGEYVTLKWGLSKSNNNITAFLMSKLSPYEFKNILHEFGLRDQSIMPVPSLCLGTCDVSVAEMVSAYTAFINKGIRTRPLYVTRIEDSDGDVIESFTALSNEVISEETSYKMIDMMRAVINEGTGARMRNYISVDQGGKTGTTDNHSDAWYIGFTPNLVTGCWVGGEERDIHFDSMLFGQGARMALPVCGIFLRNVYNDSLRLGYSPSAIFDMPVNYDPCSGNEEIDKVIEHYGIETF
ncbi:MAG TPA: transglycosylase domain-containing protein [Bacteroidaceae bacterium]|nr:transglycosylase domain-containing protein [Bacteroidaceae bacterium]